MYLAPNIVTAELPFILVLPFNCFKVYICSVRPENYYNSYRKKD